MELKQIGERVENNKVTLFLRRALSSYYFPLVTAALSLLCYYLNWDLVFVWYMCLSGTAIMICCDDISPVIVLLLFMNIVISMGHYSPGTSDYFTKPAVLAQEVVGVVLFVGTSVFRLITCIIFHRFTITPMFWGLVALCVVFMFGGLFYTHYTVNNFLFGLILCVSVLGTFVAMSGNVKVRENTFCKIAAYLLAFFTVVAIELVVAYGTYEGLIQNGEVQRALLRFGWGTYNQVGFALTLTVPAWFYLSGKFKYGFVFLIGAFVNVVFCFLSMSRQAMLMSVLLFAVCCVWRLVRERGVKRLFETCILAGVIVVTAIILGVLHDKVGRFFSLAWNSLKTGSGRTKLWEMGMQNFLHKPLFGVGWYDPSAGEGQPGYMTSNSPFSIPYMCHNTIVQMLCSCGLIGLIAYVVHRVQTVISLVNKPTDERVFIALTTAALLLVSLLDIHIFRFFPSFLYAMFIALLSITEGKSITKQI